jgi:hypothetical protein
MMEARSMALFGFGIDYSTPQVPVGQVSCMAAV